ncbi:hypothetical protein ACTS9C_05360 [Empedobacter brevis]
MTIEEILNNYAFNQGLENWEELENCSNNLTFHIKEVAQLIQDELKKKMHIEYVENNNKDWYDYTKQENSVLILNTENIK